MTEAKIEPAFKPETPMEKFIYAGDYDGTVDFLAGLTEAEREKQRSSLMRMETLMGKTDLINDPSSTAWRIRASKAQVRAICIAIFLCGTATDFAHFLRKYISPYDSIHVDLIPLWRRFNPRASHGLAEALMKTGPFAIHFVQLQFLAGLIERPSHDNYVLGLLMAPVKSDRDSNDILHWIEQDPGLPLLRLFEVEGTSQISLAGTDKYSHKPEHTWQRLFLDLCRRGIYSREVLLDKTIGALEKDWIQFHSGWFSRFHDALAPTPTEMAPFADRYLGLCQSRIPPTVTLALKVITVLYSEGAIEGKALLEALAPVASSGVKGHVDGALKLLAALVKRDPQLAHDASAIAKRGLAHESPDIQKKVIDVLAAWGVSEETKAGLGAFLPHVSATNREALSRLASLECPEIKSTGLVSDLEHNTPPAAKGPLSPLDPSRVINPINDINDLVESIAFVLENGMEIDEFERVLEALARLSPFSEEKRRSLTPVLKRARKFKPTEHDRWYDTEKPIIKELARFLIFILDNERLPRIKPDYYESESYTTYDILCRRIDDLMDLVSQAKGVAPLASPTHRGGYIDPKILIERVAAHDAAGCSSSLQEQVLSLLRLAPCAGEDVRTKARALPDSPYVRALRYALGDDVPVGSEKELFVAAGRIRHPGEDDPDLIAAYGDLGPDGPHAARYSWTVYGPDGDDSENRVYNYGRFTTSPLPRPTDPGFLSIIRHQVQLEAPDYKYFLHQKFINPEEGLIKLAATILPSSLEAFFAEGVQALSDNRDWASAEWYNKAYINVLLDPTTPMTPLAVKTLAVGLAGKEPGQTTMAIDALLAAWSEGRLDIQALARTMHELLDPPLAMAARYHKSLKAAARAHAQAPRMVFDLLCTLVVLDPEKPPRDTGLLLELLLELMIELRLPLPQETKAGIEKMKLGGKGKTVQKELLLRTAGSIRE
ncbi:MAG: hypothetical protein JW943_10825 [Deltaproteobacteria bacterium]|nr:hypothetical protein [Deltaproteobacteria bacterium]